MSRDEPIIDEQWNARGRTAAEALESVLDRVHARVVDHLPDLIAARPGTRMVVECRNVAKSPGMPSFAITMEIVRLRDRETNA